jgi:hypothetical protein
MFLIDGEVAVWAEMCRGMNAVDKRAEPMRRGKAVRRFMMIYLSGCETYVESDWWMQGGWLSAS